MPVDPAGGLDPVADVSDLEILLEDESFESGVFYASKANTLSGPVIDQSTIFPDLKNETYQDNAYKAVHRFVAA